MEADLDAAHRLMHRGGPLLRTGRNGPIRPLCVAYKAAAACCGLVLSHSMSYTSTKQQYVRRLIGLSGASWQQELS